MRIDQLVPAYHQGDAIGDTATHLKEFFRSQGIDSQIFCLDRDRGLEEESKLFKDFSPPSSGDATILHYALPSPLSEAFSRLSSRRVMIYHNITPECFFQDYSPEMARISRLGRKELQRLFESVDLGLADSEFNRLELEEMGYRNTAVFPLFIDFSKYEKPPSRSFMELFQDDRTNIMFVGRIVPNKKIEDLIKVIFYYKKYISPLVRLIIVGKRTSLPSYFDALVRMADEFYLKPEEICFTGHITDEEMFSLYRLSDVFLSLSEHEGFGLPFIESMIFDLPIIAYQCTAVPYTLGESGIQIRSKPVDRTAELIHRLATEGRLRDRVIEGQRRRLISYREQDLSKFILENIKVSAGGVD